MLWPISFEIPVDRNESMQTSTLGSANGEWLLKNENSGRSYRLGSRWLHDEHFLKNLFLYIFFHNCTMKLKCLSWSTLPAGGMITSHGVFLQSKHIDTKHGRASPGSEVVGPGSSSHSDKPDAPTVEVIGTVGNRFEVDLARIRKFRFFCFRLTDGLVLSIFSNCDIKP